VHSRSSNYMKQDWGESDETAVICLKQCLDQASYWIGLGWAGGSGLILRLLLMQSHTDETNWSNWYFQHREVGANIS